MKMKVVLSLVLSTMLLFATGCSDSQVKACAQAAAAVSDGLKTVQAENEVLFAAGKLDVDDAKTVANAVNTGTFADDAFVTCVKGIKGNADSQNKQVVACFSNLTDTLAKVKGEVLHVKNPDSQQALGVAFQSVQTALTAIRAFIPAN